MIKNEWQEYFDGFASHYMAEAYAQPWRQEVDFYLEVLDLPQGSSILDIGCGTGRHCVELAKRGYQVTGIDFSRGMLAEAQKAAQSAGVTIEWIHRPDLRSNISGVEPLAGKRSTWMNT